MAIKSLTEASLPVNSKFVLTELEWSELGISSSGFTDGVWKEKGEGFISDATISENYAMTANVPTYPVEAGFPLADGSGVTDFTVTISAINSNSSMSLIDIVSSLDAIASSSVGQQLGGLFDLETRVQKAYNRLETWAMTGTPLSLKSTYAKDGYKDQYGDLLPFLISGFSITRDINTGDSIGYTMTLNAVKIARVQRTTVQAIEVLGKVSIVDQVASGNEALPNDAAKAAQGNKSASDQNAQGKGIGNYLKQISETANPL